jgi:hypothetical protein
MGPIPPSNVANILVTTVLLQKNYLAALHMARVPHGHSQGPGERVPGLKYMKSISQHQHLRWNSTDASSQQSHWLIGCNE